MATGVVLVPLALAVVRRIAPRHGAFFARWGFSHVFLLLVAGVVIGPLVQAVLPGEGVVAGIARSVLVMALLACGALIVAQRRHPEEFGALGLQRRGSGRALLAGVAGYLVLLPVFFGLIWLWPAVARALELPGGPQPVLEGILALRGSELLFAAAVAVLFGPLCEELVFRGFLQPLLVQNFHERGGIALCAFVFAILHGIHAFLPLFALSLFLGWLQVQTQRIAAPFTVHALHNALTLSLALAADPSP